ncbi:hypothetical protein [Catenulispora pinisilvae]|uniref:hypothetical protein n=1 Tax=Catenulispora pinisilvae TaxID=2705253 RepID=UPI0018928749|nr:hypothetical protein [Catenulispora pinisilvae]
MSADEQWTGPDVEALRMPPADVVERLVEVCGDLKEGLVEYVWQPRFSKQVNTAMRRATDRRHGLDERSAMAAIDQLALETKLHDGTTIVQRFAEQHRPPFDDEQKAILLGWQDVVESIFEVREHLEGGGVLLHNLLDDLLYPTWATNGPDAVAPMTPGSFAVTRIVPAHAEYDMWLFSGPQSLFGPDAGPVMAQSAMQTGMAGPRAMRRNTALVTKAWEMQAEERATFLEVAGADFVVGTPTEMRELLLAFRRERQRLIEEAHPAAGADDLAGPGPEDLVSLPDEILDAESLAVVYHEAEGLSYFAEFAAVAKPFTVPADQLSRALLARLKDFLNDETVPPHLIRRLAAQYPDTVDQVFAALLGKPGFSWTCDGETLLARKKPEFFDREPTPSITVTGTRLAELLRART